MIRYDKIFKLRGYYEVQPSERLKIIERKRRLGD